MPHREFTLGSLVRLTIAVTQDGNPVDPTTVTVIVEEPDGNEITVVGIGGGLVNPAVGTWYYDYDAAKAGTVEYRWKTAAPQGASESYFVVPASRVSTP